MAAVEGARKEGTRPHRSAPREDFGGVNHHHRCHQGACDGLFLGKGGRRRKFPGDRCTSPQATRTTNMATVQVEWALHSEGVEEPEEDENR